MRKAIVLFVILITAQKIVSQELAFEDGIYYEKAIYSDTSEHRYSLDNITYRKGDVFIYDYYFLDSFGREKKFQTNEVKPSDDNPMQLTDYSDSSLTTIDKVRLTVTDNLNDFIKFDTTYSQTVFTYEYLNSAGDVVGIESTGIIDNRINLWIHPPRTDNFRILEINPFPFYCLKPSTKKWTWKLKVGGSHWSDPRWKSWKGSINLNYTYIRQKDETLKTALGNIKCKVTKSEAVSEIGNTYLKSYYHSKYGFVRLEFININGTKLIMELVAMKE